MSFTNELDTLIAQHGPTNAERNRVLRFLASVSDNEWRASPGFRAVCAALPDLEHEKVDWALWTLVRNGWVSRERAPRVRQENGKLAPRSRDVYRIDVARLALALKQAGQS